MKWKSGNNINIEEENKTKQKSKKQAYFPVTNSNSIITVYEYYKNKICNTRYTDFDSIVKLC